MKTIGLIILSLFLLGSVSLLFVAKKDNNSLYTSLNSTRKKTDSLSNLNSALQSKVKKLNSKADSLSSKNGELQKSLTQTNTTLIVKERERLKANQSFQEASKKYNDLATSQKDLENQMGNLKNSNSKLDQENKNLTNKIVLLNETNNQLNGELVNTRLISKDNILIESFNKRGKLNNKGKKVMKIALSFNSLAEMKNPSFKMFDPNGIQLPDSNGSFNFQTLNDNAQSSLANKSLKVDVTYSLSKKIGPGLYRIEILCDSKHAGNLLMKFR